MGSDFSSRIGAAISFAWATNLDVEAEVGYRRTDMNALGASVNLVYNLPPLGRMIPYVAGGAGLEQYETSIAAPAFGVLTLKNTAFSTNLGGGVKVPINERLGFRSDARWLSPLGKAPEGWRIYTGATFGVGKR
jgi:opacity protein-like surface antigen